MRYPEKSSQFHDSNTFNIIAVNKRPSGFSFKLTLHLFSCEYLLSLAVLHNLGILKLNPQEINATCFHRPQAKVMFSEIWVILFKGGGESPSPWTETPRAETPHSGQRPPGGRHPWVLTSSGGHCSGGYASYWNAFLLLFTFCRVNITPRGVFYLQKSHYPRRSGISCFLFCIFFDVLIILKYKYE